MIKKNIINKNKKQIGGDGYSFNLDQPIGGNPGFIRYSNNSRPIFEGDLLDGASSGALDGASNGASDCQISNDSGYNILTGGSKKKISKSKSTKSTKSIKSTKSKSTKKTKDCGCTKQNSIYDLIKLQGGGGSEPKKVTQFDAIREVAYNLSTLKSNDLTQLNVKLFNNIMLRKNQKKAIQYGGYAGGLEEILAPLGKNNLLVLAALLLLHHFAVERRFPNKSASISTKLKGGNPFLSSITNIITPIGNSTILESLHQAFIVEKSSEKKTKQFGGNPLRQLIEPLGSEAFLAVGLLIIIERFFTSKVNQMKKSNKETKDDKETKDEKKTKDDKETKDEKKSKIIKKDGEKKSTQLKGGRVNMYYDKLFNLLAPITFNAFATEDFLEKMSNNKK